MPDYGRKRHPGRTFSRPTHSGYADKLFGGEHVASERADALGAVKRTGESFADARDGEQTQVADVAPRIIQTEHFDYEAAAPQVNNNPQEPTQANVYVDRDGLHVLDGAIFLSDYSGYSVLTPSGFAGSWVEFTTRGVYNAEFNGGPTVGLDYDAGGGNTAVTEIGGADTTAEYEDSLSTDIPFFIIKTVNSQIKYGLIFDATHGRVAKIGTTGATTGTRHVILYQDVPVVPGVNYDFSTRQAFVADLSSSWTKKVTLTASWRDEDHGSISSVSGSASTTNSTSGGLNGLTELVWQIGKAPETARYCRVTVDMDINANNRTAIYLKSVSLTKAPRSTRYEIPYDVSILGVDLSATPQYIDMDRTISTRPMLFQTQGSGAIIDIGGGASWISNLSIKVGSVTKFVFDENAAMWMNGLTNRILPGSTGGDLILDNAGTSNVTRFYVRSSNGQDARFFIGRNQSGQNWDWAVTVNSAGEADIQWGPGSGVSGDVSLKRTAANVLTLGSGDRLDADAVGLRRARTTNQTISNSTWTRAALTTNEWTGLGVDLLFTNNVFRALVAGTYVIVGRANFVGSTGGTRRIIGVSFNTGSGSPSATPASVDETTYVTGGNSFDIHMVTTMVVRLSVNDTFALNVHQDSGGNLAVTDAVLSCARIGA